MWKCSYTKEPFDCRLMVLLLIRKIWIPVLGAVAGALLIGGGYRLFKDVIVGEKMYSVTSKYSVLYGYDPQTGLEYTYINNYTWNTWMSTDLFQELITKQLAKEEIELTKEELTAYLTADLPSDQKMPITVVTTPDEELSIRLNRAVQAAMEAFGEQMTEIERLWVVDTGAPIPVDNSPRTVQAGILGAVSGALFVLFVMFVRYCLGEAVWVPETFTFRFGIPAVGFIAAGEDTMQETDISNLLYLLRGKKRIAVTAYDEQLDLLAAAACLPASKELQYVCIPSMEQVPESAELLRAADGVLLILEAGTSCGRNIMHLLENMKLQDIAVTGAILWKGDRKLLKAYYKMPF